MQKPNCSSCPAGIDVFPLKKCEANGGGGGATGPTGPQGKRGKAGAGIVANYLGVVGGAGAALTDGVALTVPFVVETANKGWSTLVPPQTTFTVPEDGTYKINFQATGRIFFQGGVGGFSGTAGVEIMQTMFITGQPALPITDDRTYDLTIGAAQTVTQITPMVNPEIVTTLTAGTMIGYTYEITVAAGSPTVGSLILQNAFLSIQRID